MRHALLTAALLALAACDNAGATRTVGVTATGVVRGEVFFDANGSGVRDAVDAAMPRAVIRVLSRAGADTVLRDSTGTDGTFRFAAVPVGTWVVEVDSASLGDTVVVAGGRRDTIVVLPNDSLDFPAAVTYPGRSVAQVRAQAPGVRVLVRAIALHARAAFGDTALHVVDASGALRLVHVRPSAATVAAGDSLVVSGRVATLAGQRVLDDVALFVVGPTLIPTLPAVTTAVASTGGVAGSLDAALVRTTNVLVTDTATVNGDFQMTVTDGSGPVTVVLDRNADTGFRAPLPTGVYVPGNRFDALGVLVPTGAGAWRLKPRSSLDLTRR